jgi:hypothetical protein
MQLVRKYTAEAEEFFRDLTPPEEDRRLFTSAVPMPKGDLLREIRQANRRG